jgi:DNA modification methylase
MRRPSVGRKPSLVIQPTTLWDYPSQHYGTETQGDPRYKGATPSYVIWNLLKRYTRENDLVVDPMCGSGTTIDVANDLKRQVRGFDLQPYRRDIEHGDARGLPLEDETVDFVFMDPPYSTHLNYGDNPNCIGKLDAAEEPYFEALDKVFAEAFRVMKDRRYMGVYISDTWRKREGFTPIGMRCLALLLQYFRPIDHVAVVRHNRGLRDQRRLRAARDENFYLRGFTHLIIMKKEV